MAADSTVFLRRDPVSKQWVTVPLADPAGDRAVYFEAGTDTIVYRVPGTKNVEEFITDETLTEDNEIAICNDGCTITLPDAPVGKVYTIIARSDGIGIEHANINGEPRFELYAEESITLVSTGDGYLAE